MAEIEEALEDQDVYIEDNSHQACYVFKSISERNEFTDTRPTKKRKTSKTNTDASAEFPLLLNGHEPESQARRREQLFDQLWSKKEARLAQISTHLNQAVEPNFTAFVEAAEVKTHPYRLPLAIFTSGSQSNVQDEFLKGWKNGGRQTDRIVADLRPSQCPNLQTTLKNIIKTSIIQKEGLDYYNDFLSRNKRLISMNFDLELLQIYVTDKKVRSIVISTLEVETFEIAVINEMIRMLHSWSDRIPVIMVVGLATTVDLFEGRLPKSSLHLIDAKIFELNIDFDPIYQIFKTCQTEDDSDLFIGSSVTNALFEMSENQNLTPQSFIQAIKYIYMSHFFSNPLSVLLKTESGFKAQDSKILCDTIRHTDSFRKCCEDLMERDQKCRTYVKKLLEDDLELMHASLEAVKHGQNAFLGSARVISALTELYLAATASSPSKLTATQRNHLDSALNVEAKTYQNLSDLTYSTTYHSIESSLRKVFTDKDLLEVLSKCSSEAIDILGLISAFQALESLQSHENDSPAVSSKASTIPKKQKGKSNNASTPNKSKVKPNIDLTKIQNEILNTLETTLHRHSFPPSITSDTSLTSSILPLAQEVYIFNLNYPLLGSQIAPRPRNAIERALSKPLDYLSQHNEDVNASHMPPASGLLYNLLSEAGITVNVKDLFDAFKSRLHSRLDEVQTEDRDEGDVQSDLPVKAMFYRALSELKYVGLVKGVSGNNIAGVGSTAGVTGGQGKKKSVKSSMGSGVTGDVELIAKTTWFGL